jgi:hypothetical protein
MYFLDFFLFSPVCCCAFLPGKILRRETARDKFFLKRLLLSQAAEEKCFEWFDRLTTNG